MDSRADDAPVDLGTYEKPPHGWTCFHCGETFTTLGGARDHFGATPDALPGCLIRVQLGDERGLEMALRNAEAEIARLRALSGAVPTISEEQEYYLAQEVCTFADLQRWARDCGLAIVPVAGVPLSRLIQRARDYSEAYDRFHITREQMLVQAQLDALEDQKG